MALLTKSHMPPELDQVPLLNNNQNGTLGEHSTIQTYLFPITVIELGEGFVIGSDKIVTKKSGTFRKDAATPKALSFQHPQGASATRVYEHVSLSCHSSFLRSLLCCATNDWPQNQYKIMQCGHYSTGRSIVSHVVVCQETVRWGRYLYEDCLEVAAVVAGAPVGAAGVHISAAGDEVQLTLLPAQQAVILWG